VKLTQDIKGAGVNVPYATAYRALFQRAKGKPGQTVFVHGGSGIESYLLIYERACKILTLISGGVGIAAIQFARAVRQSLSLDGGKCADGHYYHSMV